MTYFCQITLNWLVSLDPLKLTLSRVLWEMYYKDAQAVIFVIDSADRLRMAVARDELEGILSHDDIAKNNSLFLFFANKMDMADACSAAEASHLLDLPSLLKGKAFHIQASNAITGALSNIQLFTG